MSFNVERKVFVLGHIWSSFPADFASVHVCVRVSRNVSSALCISV